MKPIEIEIVKECSRILLVIDETIQNEDAHIKEMEKFDRLLLSSQMDENLLHTLKTVYAWVY